MYYLYFYCLLRVLWLMITDDGSLPEMRIWSILLIKSDLIWCIHLSGSLFFLFQLLGECHCCWTSESPKAHVAKFYGRFRFIRSVLRASKFYEFKLFKIVILWVYYTIPFGFILFRHFWSITFHLFKLLCLANDHWRGFITRNAHMVHIVNWIRFNMVYTS